MIAVDLSSIDSHLADRDQVMEERCSSTVQCLALDTKDSGSKWIIIEIVDVGREEGKLKSRYQLAFISKLTIPNKTATHRKRDRKQKKETKS